MLPSLSIQRGFAMSNVAKKRRKAKGGSSASIAPRCRALCPRCQLEIGRMGIDGVPDMNGQWWHHQCQMEEIHERSLRGGVAGIRRGDR